VAPSSAHAGLAALLVGSVFTVARLLPSSMPGSVVLVALAPLGVVPYLLAVPFFAFALSRRTAWRWSAAGLVLAAAGLAGHLAWVLPAYVGPRPYAGARPDLVVAEVNMAKGAADPATIVGQVRRHHADVLVVAEITPAGLSDLRAEGLAALLPYQAGGPGPGRTGLMVFARAPLSDATRVPGASSAYRLKVRARVPYTLIAAHAAQPMVRGGQWDRDGRALATAVRGSSGRIVLAGDLNATDDHELVRRLFGAGLSDAARDANAGWQPTWPGGEGIPVLRRIGVGAVDHVLVGGRIGVVSTDTTVVAGTDHRMLVARLTTAG
jgi:endonuclease/exonuclease/phosphatase (EEP) superfamily protein YafD